MCVDSDYGALDPYGDGCDDYASYPSWCGGYDDDDFTSVSMCCACGGAVVPTFYPTASHAPTKTFAPTSYPTISRAPTTARSMSISGSCQDELNDIFIPQNQTADGRWYYRGETYGIYLFYDADCDGFFGWYRQWYFDASEPSTTAAFDLDEDGDCTFTGFTADNDGVFTMEPRSGTWSLHCASAWTDAELTLTQR